MKLHAIVGYDLDKKSLFGMVIDHGPYAATMTGSFDEKSKTINWMTEGKEVNGKSLKQKTLITQTNADERLLVLSVPGKQENEFTKFMEIKFTKRKQDD